jgi:hypothetical protein
MVGFPYTKVWPERHRRRNAEWKRKRMREGTASTDETMTSKVQTDRDHRPKGAIVVF